MGMSSQKCSKKFRAGNQYPPAIVYVVKQFIALPPHINIITHPTLLVKSFLWEFKIFACQKLRG